jgi:amino acid permease
MNSPYAPATLTSPKIAVPICSSKLLISSLGLAKAAVGAGALLFPSCFHRLGIFGGIIISCLAAALTHATLSFVGSACNSVQANDFMSLARLAGSSTWAWIAAIGQIALLFGPLLVFLSLTGEYCHAFIKSLTGFEFPSANLLQFIVGLGIILPLTLKSNSKLLNNLGVLGMIGMCYVALLCIFDVLVNHRPMVHSDVSFLSFVGAKDAISAIPTIIFSFSSHLAFPLLLSEMPSSEFTSNTIFGSVLATLLIYVTIGIFGYSRFGPLVYQKDILKVGFENGSLPAELVVAVSNIVSCPILILSLLALVKWIRGDAQVNSDGHSTPLPTPLSLTRAKLKANELDTSSWRVMRSDNFIIVVITVLAVVIVPFSGSISSLFDTMGALFGAPIALILPSVFYLKACKPEGVSKSLAYFCIGVGAVLLLTSFIP